MCFGEQHSWITFIFGALFVGLSAYKYSGVSRDALVLIMIMGLVVIMQLWEALAWRGFCKLASWGGYISVLLQTAPLFLLLLPWKQQLGSLESAFGSLESAFGSLESAFSSLESRLALALIVLYYGTVFIGSGVPSCILADGKQIRYTWFSEWWQQLGYVLVFTAVPLLLMRDRDIAWFWVIAFLLAQLVTQWVYGELHTNGSIWCYYGAASAVLVFAILYYKFGADGRSRKKIIG